MFKSVIRLTAAMLIVTTFISSRAAASEPGPQESVTVSLNTVTDAGLLWVAADVDGDAAETVSIKIMAPGKNGKSLWQRCKLPFSGSGRYLCGIDVSDGSSASTRNGTWAARVEIDGAAAGRIRFHV